MDTDSLVQKYHTDHEVVYELRVMVDGEVLFKRSSLVSADDVTLSADTIDQLVIKHIISEQEADSE